MHDRVEDLRDGLLPTKGKLQLVLASDYQHNKMLPELFLLCGSYLNIQIHTHVCERAYEERKREERLMKLNL